MVDYIYVDLFLRRSVDKQVKIFTDDGMFVATNSDISWNGFEISESLCSDEEIQFGLCEPSMIKFRIINAFIPLAGKWLTVTETLDGKADAPFQFGRYKVFSDKPTADREYRDIIAYDALYDMISADMTDWYNNLLPDNEEGTWVTMRSFRTSFMRHFGIEQEEKELANDYIKVDRTISPEQISGKDIIESICEINGCFGHIGRDGKFHYIYLEQDIQGLYPRNDLFPADDLYPRNPKSTRIGKEAYIKCEYEDYEVKTIDKLQIRQSENDIGCIYGSGNNSYIIEDNFLVYGKGAEELNEIARRIYEKITGIVYRPFSAECVGNPCLEVGDAVRLTTKNKIVESYIFSRTLKGGQVLRDNYEAEGLELRSQEINSIEKSIIQLKGKTNELFRDVEKNELKITDVEKGLTSTITQTAEGIRADVAKTYETKANASTEYTNIRSSVSIEAGRITSEIERATKVEQSLSGQITNTTKELTSKIEQTESSINLSVSSKIEETKTYASTQATAAQNAANAATDNKLKSYSTTTQMNSAISISAEGIKNEVSKTYETITDAGKQYSALSSSIAQTAEQISLKVSKGDVSSEISQEAGKIHLEADRLSWNSTHSSMTEDGEFSTSKANITGGRVEVHGDDANDTRIAVRLKDAFSIEISASSINGHMKYLSGTLRNWMNLAPTASWFSSPLTIGEEMTHITYAMYVGGGRNSYISNVLELENPTVVGSDRRLKDNVRYISDSECLNNIKKLEQAEFEYIKTPGMLHHGIIAQDAQDAFWDGWSPVRTSGEYLGVAYEEIIADLIGAVKYLAKEIGA